MNSLLNSILVFAISSPLVSLGRSLGSRDDVVCYFAPSDVIFVMDESQSVGQADFDVGLNAAASLTDSLTIGTGATDSRVGFVLFDMDGHLVFGLNQYTNNADVANAIRNVSYDGGDTNIAGGMDVALQEFKVHYNGKVNSLMIIITDGHDDSDVSTSYRSALFVGVDVWALAVGNKTNHDELVKATGDASHVIPVADYAGLLAGLQKICYDIGTTVNIEPTTAVPAAAKTQLSCGCEDPDDEIILHAWLDIIVVIDSSQEVSDDHYNDMKVFLQEVAEYYHIGEADEHDPAGQFSRVALINTADEAHVIANLSTFKNSDDLMKAVKNLQRASGAKFHAYEAIAAVDDIVNVKLNASDRLNVRTVVLLFSSASITCNSKNEKQLRAPGVRKTDDEVMCETVAQLKNDNVIFITVGVGLDGQQPPLINIADECFRLSNTGDMNSQIALAFCRANCYCLTPTTQFTVESSCDRYAECLYIHELSSTYSTAKQACSDLGGSLPDMFTEEKKNFLNDLHIKALRKPYWLGAKVYDDTIFWESGRYNTSRLGNNGDYIHWDPAWKPTTGKPCLMAYAGFDLLWNTDKESGFTTTHYYSCQTEACSVHRYCNSTRLVEA